MPDPFDPATALATLPPLDAAAVCDRFADAWTDNARKWRELTPEQLAGYGLDALQARASARFCDGVAAGFRDRATGYRAADARARGAEA